jgi:hypothetical protein
VAKEPRRTIVLSPGRGGHHLQRAAACDARDPATVTPVGVRTRLMRHCATRPDA